MDRYVERLLKCGWRIDNAWMIVNDLMRELDFDGLEEFIRREELSCG